jgi:hypothetical protein
MKSKAFYSFCGKVCRRGIAACEKRQYCHSSFANLLRTATSTALKKWNKSCFLQTYIVKIKEFVSFKEM